MKIKAIIITMFFIGAFFSGSALAATMGAATSDFSDQNMRDVDRISRRCASICAHQMVRKQTAKT